MQRVVKGQLSLVVPVYRNEGSIDALVDAIATMRHAIDGGFEAIFVVDGSPDHSLARLLDRLPGAPFRSRLITLTRNFGAFPAIRVGLEAAEGEFIAFMAADLQEPPELVPTFHRMLRSGEYDVVFGTRGHRDDPWTSVLTSRLFWGLYRRFVVADVPSGGVDVFGITHAFRDKLLRLGESNSSLLAQMFWLGGRRGYAPYDRARRQHGRSAWTVSKKLRYFADSVFSFTDLPIRFLLGLGVVSLLMAVGLGAATLVAKLTGAIEVPGYAGTMLVILSFGAFNALGLGVVGTYAWRAFENTKARPLAVVHTDEAYAGRGEEPAGG